MGWYIEVTEDGRYIVRIERPLDVSVEEMREMIDSAINIENSPEAVEETI